MKNTLENIKRENESILTMTLTGDYCQYKLLMDNDIHSDDISQILEYTLHRMVDAGFTESEIHFSSGMFIPIQEQIQDLKQYDEFIYVDLDYVLGGLILNIE